MSEKLVALYFLWSWDLGYPINPNNNNIKEDNDYNYAYLDTTDIGIAGVSPHFKNMNLIDGSTYTFLCVYSNGASDIPGSDFIWYTNTGVFSKNNPNSFNCDKSDKSGKFAVPTTSYWMNDMINDLKSQNIDSKNIIVNYIYKKPDWVANDSKPLWPWVNK